MGRPKQLLSLPVDISAPSLVFGALADPTRREILSRLGDGDATVSELAAPFSSSLEPGPLEEATAWMERYRRFWDANFDRLDAHLKRMQSHSTDPQAPPNPRGNSNDK